MADEVDLSGLALFVRIVEQGSLSAAGRSLGLPKATVSRRLALLEASIGVALLTRSTRTLHLTEAGRRYFERVQPIVREAHAAQTEIMTANSEPAGTLRISLPVAFGQAVIAPKLVRFLGRHPRMRADLHFSDERVNVIADGFDLAIRMGDLADSNLVSRHLADVPIAIVAAPGYLASAGEPRTPQDLRHHLAVMTRKAPDHWLVAGEPVRVPWRLSTGNMMVTRDAVRSGLGIALMPVFFVHADLADGTLVRLLPSHDLPKSSATALYPRAIVPSRALRSLIDTLTDSGA